MAEFILNDLINDALTWITLGAILGVAVSFSAMALYDRFFTEEESE